MGILIDSTLLVAAERQRLTPEQLIAQILERWGNADLALSVMSAGELLHGCWRADTAVRRARREEFVETLLAAIPVAVITLPIMRLYAQIAAQMQSSRARPPTSDLLIACTALSRGDQIVTGNARHFRRVPGLEVHEWK